MKTNTTPSLVSNSTPAVLSGFTLGLDLGDRQHHVCVLDASGQIVREASLPNTRPALAELLADFPRATVAPGGGHNPSQSSRAFADSKLRNLNARSPWPERLALLPIQTRPALRGKIGAGRAAGMPPHSQSQTNGQPKTPPQKAEDLERSGRSPAN